MSMKIKVILERCFQDFLPLSEVATELCVETEGLGEASDLNYWLISLRGDVWRVPQSSTQCVIWFEYETPPPTGSCFEDLAPGKGHYLGRWQKLEEVVPSWNQVTGKHTFGGQILFLAPPLSVPLLLGDKKSEWFCFITAFDHNILLHHGRQTTEPANHGVEPPTPWAKINLFKL